MLQRENVLGKKFFRCPFRYPKVPLEAGAPPQSFDASYAPGCKETEYEGRENGYKTDLESLNSEFGGRGAMKYVASIRGG
jgi:hypothetical protein